MQDQAVAGSAEQRNAKENLGAQRGRLSIRGETTGALEFSEDVEQYQDATEGCFGGEKLLQAKIIRRQIVFQFGDAIFHIRPAVVVAPNLFRRQRQVADEDAEGVARNLQQFSSQRVALGTHLLADHQEAPRTVPTVQLQEEFTRSVMLVQGTPLGDAGRLALQPKRQSSHDDVRQPTLLQKAQ